MFEEFFLRALFGGIGVAADCRAAWVLRRLAAHGLFRRCAGPFRVAWCGFGFLLEH